MAVKPGTRHASGAMKFPNGWFVEREITRNGRTHRQWFRTRDPNAQPGPRGARRRAATASNPENLQQFADKYGVGDEGKRILARQSPAIRRATKDQIRALHASKQEETKEALKPKKKRAPKKKDKDGDEDSLKLDASNFGAAARKLGLEVQGEQHFEHVNQRLFAGKMTVRDLKDLTGHDAFKETFPDKQSHPPRLSLWAHKDTDQAKWDFSAVYENKDGNADIRRNIQLDENKQPYVYHDSFFIGTKLQGGGLGRSVLKGQLAAYKRMNLPKVKVYAVDVGRYYWRKIGFEREDKVEFDHDKRKFGDYLKYDKKMKPEAVSKIVDQIKTSRQLATVEINGQRLGKEWATSDRHKTQHTAEGGDFTLKLSGAGWKHVQEEFGL